MLSSLTRLGLLLAMAPACAAPVSLNVRGANGQPLADAVVAVEVRGKASKTSSAKAELAQRDRQFQPTVLVVQTGTAVSFPNFDTVRHHVYSISATKVFDLKLYAGKDAEPVVFDKAGVAALGCNIHDRMSAHIVVVDTPVFGRTDAQGHLTLDLPPGEHRLLAWHAAQKSPNLQTQTLTTDAAGAAKTVTLD